MVVEKILPVGDKSIQVCKNALNNGDLIAFPTETVYGLGANALNPIALEKIFEAKKRPKSDPLIVHVSKLEDAFPLTEMTPFQKSCFLILGKKFWPGPITIIVRASKQLPALVTSNSEFVGIRIPNHPVALKLLKECGFPLAAPSANLFGHVSPTTAQHVFQDLGYYNDLLILDTTEPCSIGIESTIIKINNEKEITLLRPGAISSLVIENELKCHHIETKIIHKRKEIKENDLNNIESSGQFLTHYSPTLESFILSSKKELNTINDVFLSQCVLIDFNSRSLEIKNKTAGYFDLSQTGNYLEACKNLFSYFRRAESVKNAEFILLPDFSTVQDELGKAIFDRIYRAASGKFY